MKLTKIQIAIICLIVANIIWGATAPIYKWTLQDIQPYTFTFLRFALCALLILPFTYKHLKIRRDDLPLLLFISVIGLGFRLAYNIYGLKMAPSINELIISSAGPAFLFVGAIVMFHEKIKKKVLQGTIISLLGIIIIVLHPIFSQGFDLSLTGNIFFVVAMGLNVFYMLLLKELAPRYRVLTILFWTFVIAAFTLLPFTGAEIMTNGFLVGLNMQGVLGLSYAIIFATLIAYGLNLYGLRHIKVSEVGIFSYVDPFVGVAIANPLLGEHVTRMYLLGALLVFLGIFIAEGRIHYHPIHLLKRKEAVIPIDELAQAKTRE
jgi:drug/metabolite transporter (DMT)-like permease